jgi:hypothetical protein
VMEFLSQCLTAKRDGTAAHGISAENHPQKSRDTVLGQGVIPRKNP